MMAADDGRRDHHTASLFEVDVENLMAGTMNGPPPPLYVGFWATRVVARRNCSFPAVLSQVRMVSKLRQGDYYGSIG